LFRLAYDKKHLYIHAKCLETNIGSMKSDTRENDMGGFTDDSIELFIDPAGEGNRYYHFCINSAGAVYDALEDRSAPGATANVSWNSGIKVKSAVKKNYWELRAAVPFANLVKRSPRANETWRFNLCRNRYAGSGAPPYSAWSPTLGGFHAATRFGVITFNRPEDNGRAIWACDFESPAFAGDHGEGPLIDVDGWFETILYAGRGWDASWKVVRKGKNHTAVCNVNKTNSSDLVPVHSANVLPGRVCVEAMFRRHAIEGNAPTLQVTDLQDRILACMHAWNNDRGLVAIEQVGNRQNYGNKEHGLGELAAPGKWFGLKLVLDTDRREITGYAKSGQGKWVKLNKKPLPYYNAKASGTQWSIGLGTYKHKEAEKNVLELDNIRVVQLSVSGSETN